ncbi:hypothetical protein HAX54_030326, partial [Datura stramonium]|nr:hypothetical protein [Datura stramonium]
NPQHPPCSKYVRWSIWGSLIQTEMDVMDAKGNRSNIRARGLLPQEAELPIRALL